MRFNVVVSWEMTANVPVEAETLEEAEEKATALWHGCADPETELETTYGPEYRDGTFRAEGEAGGSAEVVVEVEP